MVLVLRSLSGLLVCGLALGVALPSPNEGRRELEAAQNEVWPPPTPSDRGSVSFSTLIKALYRLNALSQPEEVELDVEFPPSEEPSDITTPDDDYPWHPSGAPHLVEELPDALPLLPLETDKSHKFTHSFRFGYGAPV